MAIPRRMCTPAGGIFWLSNFMKITSDQHEGARFAALIPLFVALISFSACAKQPVYPTPAVEGRETVVQTAALKSDIPQFFTYHHHGKNVSFFVIKLDHKIVSFLDACASCYPHKQGYRYDKEGIVTCRYCNMQFSIYKLEKGIGGCYPIRIEGRAEKDSYRIPLSVLENAIDRF